jgi:hypothetical protein
MTCIYMSLMSLKVDDLFLRKFRSKKRFSIVDIIIIPEFQVGFS